ncbi:MAG: crotonase/enoyl-CoA hydratase family protein [Gammaproteobacteria bacterium]|nr:crotonase/enoyl-CoA hydratase family protein [Gammaproteobacteria bacterium]
MEDMLTIETHGKVALLKIDDGKANVVSEAFSKAVNEGLDAALESAAAVVLAGRPGCFSAGFDLGVIRAGTPAQATAMRQAGARTMHRLFTHPQPVVMACSGHALAAGALILLAGDTRIGISGDFKIGLNETAIGLALPAYGLELAKARMPPYHHTKSVIQAHIHTPESAIEAGYLDEVVAPEALMDTALERAAQLAAMPAEAYATVKQRMRDAAAQAMAAAIDSA